MKRFLLGLIAILLTATLGGSSPSFAAVNDFTISSYAIDYYLGSNDSGHSTLKTVETITADFPQSNQNHGLERAIPTSYDGHPTQLHVQSVTNADGGDISYSTNTINGNEVLRIGDADHYVHGLTTYIITYTQRDTTRYFADTGVDEFYWDTNGTQWAVPIAELSVRIHLDHSITPTFTKNMACYQGGEKSVDRCKLTQDKDVIATTANNLRPYENVTVSLGFTAGTFIGYQQTPMEKILSVLGVIWVISATLTSVAAIGCFIWLVRRYRRISERKQDIGTVVPEYLPPHNHSVLVSAQIEGLPTRALTATLIDLAVRHYIKIYQTRTKTIFRAAQYELELVKPSDDLSKEERALIGLLFADESAIGSRFTMSSLTDSYTLGRGLEAVTQTAVIKDIKGDYDLRHKDNESASWFKRFGLISFIVGVVSLSPLVLVLSLIAYLYGVNLWPLTDTGVVLRRYLLGLKMYISVAETDRLKMLQSPEGAEKIGGSLDDASDSAQLVKLYERVLPYAVLFGQETEWNKQLGAYYETTNNQPDWYSGTGAFNAVAFGAAISSFTTTSTYATSSSSTSGGSGGGGFSGGGGGGGGGGGW